MIVPTATPRDGDAAITLRPLHSDDHAFIFALYASTREQELAAVPWDAEQKAAFLQMQFAAQHAHYQEHFGDAAFDIVLVEGQPAGRLYVRRSPDQVHIIDISILPAYRNRGVGSHLLTALQQEAAARGVPVRIHVERFNPARRLYDRLGFKELADRGVYLFLEWRGDPKSGAVSS